MNFIKINKQLLKTNETVFCTALLLGAYTNHLNKCVFSLNNIITELNLKPARGKGNTIEQFKEALSYLQDNNIINGIDIDSLKANDCIKCDYTPSFDKNNKDEDINFISFPVDTLIKLLGTQNKSVRTNIYLMGYLLSYMNKDKQYCYPTYDLICNDLNISDKTLTKAVKELTDLELLFVDNIGLISKNKKQLVANNVYALNKDSLKSGLTSSQQYYALDGYKVLSNRDKHIVNKINGLKGSIKKTKNKGGNCKAMETKLIKEQSKLKDDCTVSVMDLKKEIYDTYNAASCLEALKNTNYLYADIYQYLETTDKEELATNLKELKEQYQNIKTSEMNR